MSRQRKFLFTLIILYTLAMLYFLFLAFGRRSAGQTAGYTFIGMPDSFYKLPSLTEPLHPTLMALVDFCNVAAFIPYGILIPLVFRVRFVRFIALFIAFILVCETVQALTLLGSFDVNDAIQNSLGAAVGFGAYKLGARSKNGWRAIAATAVSGPGP
ncbi:VanZ family protein [Paenibacillus sp. UNC496MF]|uniref:VanZ family protein n=1 Tax=Paenibacillus sp. UNC496MF TaxID=1502753 RepID=UPI00352964EB